MNRALARVVRFSLACGALVALAAGCNLALGLPDYQDAAVQLCGCPGVAGLFSDCTTRVHDALEAASPEEREAWLSTFAAEDCGECGSVGVCLQTEPVCRQPGEPCSKVADCCGLGDGTGYCYEGECRREAPSCKHAFEPCQTADDCCGSEAGLAACYAGDDGPMCYEFCASADQAQNCPGCCTHVEGAGLPKDALCLDGTTAAALLESITLGATTCQSACYLGVDEDCPAGTQCERVSLGGGAQLHYCIKQ